MFDNASSNKLNNSILIIKWSKNMEIGAVAQLAKTFFCLQSNKKKKKLL